MMKKILRSLILGAGLSFAVFIAMFSPLGSVLKSMGIIEYTTAQAANNPNNILFSPNISTLQALGAASGFYPVIQVLDYGNGAGGGGLFAWNGTSTAAGNSCTVFAAAGISTGRWIRQSTLQAPLPIESCGGIGKDGSYNAGHAVINATAFAAAVASVTAGEIDFRNCPYSITGVTIGNVAGQITLAGCGSGQYFPTWIGSGLPYAFASVLGAGDPCKTEKFVIQNGFISGFLSGDFVIRDFTVNTTGTGVSPIGLCFHNVNDFWYLNTEHSTFYGGDYGLVLEYANNNIFADTTFQAGPSGLYGLYVYEQADVDAVSVNTIFQGGGIIGPGINVVNSWTIFQTNHSLGSTNTISLEFNGVSMGNAFNGFTLNGNINSFYQDQFLGINAAGTQFADTGKSDFYQPVIFGTAWSFLGTGQSALSTVEQSNSRCMNALNLVCMIWGSGSPNSSIFSGPGSVYYREDAPALATSPCYQTSGSPANTGWKNAAGGNC